MTQVARTSLRELVAKAKEAEAIGADRGIVAAERDYLSDESIRLLQDRARLDPETKAALLDLEKARKESETNAYACRALIRAQIQILSEKDRIEPEEVLALLHRACDTQLSNGQPALPLFVEVPWSERGRWKTKLYQPKMREGANRKLAINGLRALVPATLEDEQSLKTLNFLLRQVATVFVEGVEGETLADPRTILRTALQLLKNASVWNKRIADRTFENGENGKLRRISDGKLFNYFTLRDDEIFTVQQSALADRFIEVMDTLAARMDLFWKGGHDTESLIASLVPEINGEMIAPSEFLSGREGFVAVAHRTWKVRSDSKETVEVIILLERRRADNAWRWVLCNRDGVGTLFSGKQLRFHDWTNDPVPAHLATLLRQGEVVDG